SLVADEHGLRHGAVPIDADLGNGAVDRKIDVRDGVTEAEKTIAAARRERLEPRPQPGARVLGHAGEKKVALGPGVLRQRKGRCGLPQALALHPRTVLHRPPFLNYRAAPKD